MTTISKTPKKAERPARHKTANRRAFPYAKVAKMWAQEKTIPEVAKAIRRVGKGDDKFHALPHLLVEDAPATRTAEKSIHRVPQLPFSQWLAPGNMQMPLTSRSTEYTLLRF
jgi:hypothetical protein